MARRTAHKETVIVEWEAERLPNSVRRRSIPDRPAQDADWVFEQKRQRERRKNEEREEKKR